jgi:hypothetical protein
MLRHTLQVTTEVPRMLLRSTSRTGSLALLVLPVACASARVPDPLQAGDRYNQAIRTKDASALYAMLDAESRRALGRERVARLLDDAGVELQRRAEALSSGDREVAARAEVRFSDGEVVSLSLERGQFRVSSAAAFPAAANTPVQALQELRAALARRSYRALAQVLSSEARGDVERQAADLAEGLEHPENLDVVIVGDRATVTTSGGHRVELVNEAGVWKVRDFE